MAHPQAFESFVLRCPNEVGAYEDAIARTSLHYLAFDPNYADDDEMGGEEEEEETMQEEEEDDDDYSDDDDISWKVRRAAAKVRHARGAAGGRRSTGRPLRGFTQGAGGSGGWVANHRLPVRGTGGWPFGPIACGPAAPASTCRCCPRPSSLGRTSSRRWFRWLLPRSSPASVSARRMSRRTSSRPSTTFSHRRGGGTQGQGGDGIARAEGRPGTSSRLAHFSAALRLLLFFLPPLPHAHARRTACSTIPSWTGWREQSRRGRGGQPRRDGGR